jgi:hypothetical protein
MEFGIFTMGTKGVAGSPQGHLGNFFVKNIGQLVGW